MYVATLWTLNEVIYQLDRAAFVSHRPTSKSLYAVDYTSAETPVSERHLSGYSASQKLRTFLHLSSDLKVSSNEFEVMSEDKRRQRTANKGICRYMVSSHNRTQQRRQK